MTEIHMKDTLGLYQLEYCRHLVEHTVTYEEAMEFLWRLLQSFLMIVLQGL